MLIIESLLPSDQNATKISRSKNKNKNKTKQKKKKKVDHIVQRKDECRLTLTFGQSWMITRKPQA